VCVLEAINPQNPKKLNPDMNAKKCGLHSQSMLERVNLNKLSINACVLETLTSNPKTPIENVNIKEK